MVLGDELRWVITASGGTTVLVSPGLAGCPAYECTYSFQKTPSFKIDMPERGAIVRKVDNHDANPGAVVAAEYGLSYPCIYDWSDRRIGTLIRESSAGPRSRYSGCRRRRGWLASGASLAADGRRIDA